MKSNNKQKSQTSAGRKIKTSCFLENKSNVSIDFKIDWRDGREGKEWEKVKGGEERERASWNAKPWKFPKGVSWERPPASSRVSLERRPPDYSFLIPKSTLFTHFRSDHIPRTSSKLKRVNSPSLYGPHSHLQPELKSQIPDLQKQTGNVSRLPRLLASSPKDN